MSDSARSSLNLEQQRKRAKELRRAHADGSADAAVRVIAQLPRARLLSPRDRLAPPLTLSEAQLVVAREAGYSSWPALKHALEDPEAAEARERDAVLDAAITGDHSRIDAALARTPDLPQRSLHLAAALADADAVAALLAADPSLADHPGGRRGWPPLLYLCASRARRHPALARLAIARQLIAAGARATGREPGFQSTHGTMLSPDHELLAIEAAAGGAADPELVRLLLDAGASLDETTVALLQAVRGGNTEVLALLLERLPQDLLWQVGWALREAVAMGRLDMARMLAAHAELPAEAAIRDAIDRGSRPEMLAVLFGDGTSARTARALNAAYGVAVRCDHRMAAEWLRTRGATESAVTPADRAIGAALVGEANPAPAADVSGSLEEEHHRMLAWATRHGREAAVPALLRVGLDAATQDLDGETPLRLAVLAGAVDAVDALLHAGAPVDARNFDGDTALDAAMGSPDRGLRERLTRRLLEAGAAPRKLMPIEPEEADAMFERAADAIASGDRAGLHALLDEEPSLTQARSARPHRATLLHYCAANGVEEQRQTPAATDPELARLLLDRGADVNATCLLYGGRATALGLALSSIHPVRAGSRRRLAEVLLRAGARLGGNRAYGDLSAMAALGDLDDVRRRLAPARASAARMPEAAHVQAAFWWACEFGRTDVADYLLDRGADSGAQNGNGQTGLHLAAIGGWLDTVQRLLARGAPIEVENEWGGTPLGNVLWAAVHYDPNLDYTPIVAAFVEAGAAVDPRNLEWWQKQDVLAPLSKPQIEALLRGQV